MYIANDFLIMTLSRIYPTSPPGTTRGARVISISPTYTNFCFPFYYTYTLSEHFVRV